MFVKAVAGGGGRGMRRVERPEQLRESIEAAMREAESAFGDATVFLEQAVVSPRHIEVQVLADGQGAVMHLFERDCSVQRRHQKVVEIAPAPFLDPEVRRSMCEHAVAFARHIGYVNAGTVEFLLAPDGRYVFIEMNPRIQVEHTVTEEITDVDLVQSQLRIASGESLADLGLSQETVRVNGAALQCRITTEDPANGFRPDTGTITTYRSAGGAGVRLDGGTVFVGAEINAHFDSMLVKAHLPRPRLRDGGAPGPPRAGRVPHPRRLHEHPVPAVAHRAARLPGRPALDVVHRRAPAPARRPGRRRPRHQACSTTWRTSRSTSRTGDPAVWATRRLLAADRPRCSGAARLARPAAAGSAPSSSPAGCAPRPPWPSPTRRSATRTSRCSPPACAPATCSPPPVPSPASPRRLWSVEAWGGATYDVALRFLGEDPWERLAALRQALPNLCIQMLLRGRNTVGYTPYPAEVTDAFVHEAARTGIDVFRVFDALNDVEQMRPAIDAVRATGTAVAEVALCYTGNLSDPRETLYTLDYYLRLAERIVDAGAHVLAVKDMAGLLRAPAARTLVTALRERFDLPVHLHTHDTAGGRSRRCSRRSTPGSTPSTPRAPRWPAPPASRRCRRWSPRSTTPRAPPGWTCAR
ncbi:hypothetical protein GCM10025868_12030 [Angustibacter aerolatus]|uniref:Pyruvate carboxylase n=1 Tax=Angustibacter aerolatus TaxID=1162965 RepID=A0ABQ6JEW1_9ACTN|nr:hypothetical protein GCM10025868_12030 [Angustibacter aerolatus]